MPKAFLTTCSTRASSRRTSMANGKCRVMQTEPTSSRLMWRSRSNSNNSSSKNNEQQLTFAYVWDDGGFTLRIDLIYLFWKIFPFNSKNGVWRRRDFLRIFLIYLFWKIFPFNSDFGVFTFLWQNWNFYSSFASFCPTPFPCSGNEQHFIKIVIEKCQKICPKSEPMNVDETGIADHKRGLNFLYRL